MRQLSRYHTLHVIMREMREMRIWPQYAAKCYKNAGKFFPNVTTIPPILIIAYTLSIRYLLISKRPLRSIAQRLIDSLNTYVL